MSHKRETQPGAEQNAKHVTEELGKGKRSRMRSMSRAWVRLERLANPSGVTGSGGGVR